MAKIIQVPYENGRISVPVKLIISDKYTNESKLFVMKMLVNQGYDEFEFNGFPEEIQNEIVEITNAINRGEM